MHLRRWLSPDPLAGSVFDPQSLNRYAYVLNNPVNLIDPLGLQCNVFNVSWEGSGQPFPCGDASTHTSQPAESPTSIAGPVGVAVGSMIGTESPEFAIGEARYVFNLEHRKDGIRVTWDNQIWVNMPVGTVCATDLSSGEGTCETKGGWVKLSESGLDPDQQRLFALYLAGRLAEGPVNLAAVGTVGVIALPVVVGAALSAWPYALVYGGILEAAYPGCLGDFVSGLAPVPPMVSTPCYAAGYAIGSIYGNLRNH